MNSKFIERKREQERDPNCAKDLQQDVTHSNTDCCSLITNRFRKIEVTKCKHTMPMPKKIMALFPFWCLFK